MIPNRQQLLLLSCVLITSIFLSGCAPLLFAGGAAAGIGIAKDAEDGQIIDD
tara:strand:- start:100 stop:255 length:156 start_codon:yes stop_codon:yes gene_type:complete